MGTQACTDSEIPTVTPPEQAKKHWEWRSGLVFLLGDLSSTPPRYEPSPGWDGSKFVSVLLEKDRLLVVPEYREDSLFLARLDAWHTWSVPRVRVLAMNPQGLLYSPDFGVRYRGRHVRQHAWFEMSLGDYIYLPGTNDACITFRTETFDAAGTGLVRGAKKESFFPGGKGPFFSNT